MKQDCDEENLTFLILHKLAELGRVIPAVDDVLHKVVLLHGAELLLSVLLFVEGLARLGHPVHVRVKFVVAGLNHVFGAYDLNRFFLLQVAARLGIIFFDRLSGWRRFSE